MLKSSLLFPSSGFRPKKVIYSSCYFTSIVLDFQFFYFLRDVSSLLSIEALVAVFFALQFTPYFVLLNKSPQIVF